MEKEKLSELQKYQKFINQPPKESELITNKAAANTQYLPISFLEMEMDEVFFGCWGCCDFKTQVVGNEIIGSITIWAIHPVTGVKIERVGAAGTMIRCKQGQPFDANGKIANALEMDYPHLKADCMRNGIGSFGKRFGRDINRKHTDVFRGILPENIPPTRTENNISSGETEIQNVLNDIQTIAELNTYYSSLGLANVKITKEIHSLFETRKNQINGN